ncbi:ferritin-like domain-containing protein [Conexibacter sp. JD483]|uniref:ferritin-like domain-containing protein n=1 Tax=unclassified Conexibacter TaxID=2627773 RepID=UPI002718F285|nr:MULTISPECIES: ferritin-like domain-containing protein [unclassified Conexibacter]MDO8188143.1 ferritin-like domain-containing protein [Conexibacter sp. CPCC 205706]MDO8201293.1 ferritin-like domain-containing protein [Conexibacter sp. CPCC 205762]MDR9370435.1 ferritin-like domain-containing protein [Conexibacter sp. JD483]
MAPHRSTAAPELAGIEIHGISRGAFLARGALAAGAVYGVGTVGPFVSEALAQSDAGDIDIVNFALTLEYLETAFYAKALTLGLRAETMRLARLLHGDEAQHVAALAATARKLGGTPAARPTFTFPITDEASFLKLAQTLEDTGVGAYNGAAPSIRSREVLGAAGSIVQVEARHAAAIRLLNGTSPAPDAFDRPLTQDAVLAAVRPLIKS